MSEWTKRQVAVCGALAVMLTIVGLALAADWVSDMWWSREAIYQTQQATCSDKDKNCAQKDLPTQIRATSAAEAMVDITLWQLVISTVGLFAILYTLRTAIRQNNIAEKAAASADRPHLIIQNVSIEMPGVVDGVMPALVRYQWVNVGKGPAWLIQHETLPVFVKPHEPEKELVVSWVQAGNRPLAPNGGEWGEMGNDPSPLVENIDNIRGTISGSVWLRIYFRVKYRGPDKSEYESHAAYWYDADEKRLEPFKSDHWRHD